MFNVILANLFVVCTYPTMELDCKAFIKYMMCSSVSQTEEVAMRHNQSCFVTLMNGSQKTCKAFTKGFCNE